MTHPVANGEPLVAETVDRSKAFAAWVAAVFFLAGLAMISSHEMWRDELQAWLIARDSRSIAELLHNMRHEGHPPLWFLLLYAVSRVTDNPFAIQPLHLGIATATAYMVARFAPFTRLQRALFCFGYFPAYEYAIITRNYVLGVLFVVAFCAAYRPWAAKRYLWLSLLLALLANTSAYGFLLAAAFALMLLYELTRMPGLRALFRDRGLEIISAALILVVGMVLSASLMVPPQETGNAMSASLRAVPQEGANFFFWNGFPTLSDIMFLLPVVWGAFVPVPQFAYQLWTTNIVESERLASLFACLLLGLSALALARSRVALVAYIAGTGALLLFTYTIFHGSVRQHGHFFILFIACLWIATLPEAQRWQSDVIRAMTRRLAGVGRTAFSALLVVHVFAGAALWGMDWRYPFSRSKEVADFLSQEGLRAAYIVADRDAPASPLAAYLNRTIYFVQGDREGTFIVWDRARSFRPVKTLLAAAKLKAAERREEVIVVASYQLERDDAVQPIAQFTGSITDENYYLYVVEPR